MPLHPQTEVFTKNFEAFRMGYKIIVNQGGTSSSKTYSIIQLLCLMSVSCAMGLISCVSESMPHLKRGVIRDLYSVLGDQFQDDCFNKSDHIYDFKEKKSQIEFFSADQADKLRGGRRNHLYINECNNITKDSFDELDVRTSGTTWLDFNPCSMFWVHELLQSYGINDFTKTCFPENHRDICFIHSTYLDAKDVLPVATVQKIEQRKTRDPNWWNVYGLGLVGNIEGLVHPVFSICDAMPKGGMSFFGMDFGFTNDPTALIYNKIIGNNLYSDMLIYQTGLTNQDISKLMQHVGLRKHYDEIFADCAEPKSIEEIRRDGWNIKPSPKGEDSVRTGIQLVNQFNQFWTKRSVDAIKEMRNYQYIRDKDGRLTNKPTDGFDHAIQARQYGVVGKIRSMTSQTTGAMMKI